MSKWFHLSRSPNFVKYENIQRCCRSFTSGRTEFPDTCLYSLLKVSPSASQKQIKTAYYKLSLVLHPDKQGLDSSKSNERFAQITEAYNILSDKNSRRNYDRSRRILNQRTERNDFHKDDIKKHQLNANRQYDTWTRSHYLNAIHLRNERVKRDRLRDFTSEEEKEARNSRIKVIAVVFAASLVFWLFPKKKHQN